MFTSFRTLLSLWRIDPRPALGRQPDRPTDNIAAIDRCQSAAAPACGAGAVRPREAQCLLALAHRLANRFTSDTVITLVRAAACYGSELAMLTRAQELLQRRTPTKTSGPPLAPETEARA